MPHILRDHFPGAFIVRLKVHSLWKKEMNKNLIVHKFYSCNTEASWLWFECYFYTKAFILIIYKGVLHCGLQYPRLSLRWSRWKYYCLDGVSFTAIFITSYPYTTTYLHHFISLSTGTCQVSGREVFNTSDGMNLRLDEFMCAIE